MTAETPSRATGLRGSSGRRGAATRRKKPAELTGPISRVGVRGGAAASVDAAGRVSVWDGAWTLDWWIGADDRWHRPAAAVGARQRRIGDGPVIETAVRVPGGDAVLRVYGARLAGADEDELVVEVVNRSHLPFAVALVAGPAPQVAIQGRVLLVDGAPALVAARPPSRVALGPLDELFARIAAGEAEDAGDNDASDSAGRAGAALLWPLPHTATLRALIPLRRRGLAPDVAPGASPATAPTAEQVASGWRGQLDAGARAELPDPTIASAVTAARAELVLAGRDLVRDPMAALRAVRAATHWGHDDVARAILAGLTDRVESDNGVAEWVALLSGLAEVQRLEGDRALAVAAIGTVAAGAARLDRALRRSRKLDDGTRAVCHQAMLDGARLLEAAGQADAADHVRADAKRHRPASAPPWSVADLAPMGDLGAVATYGTAGQLVGEDAATDIEVGDDEFGDDWSDHPPTIEATSTVVHLARAVAETSAGSPAGWDRVRRALASASPTWTWTEPSAGPVLLEAVRRALVVEVTVEAPWSDPKGEASGPQDRADGDRALRLDLLLGWNPLWWGQPVAAYRLPTAGGALSFALRWHGGRPALLWEIDPSGTIASVELRVPSLDPGWRDEAWRGEVLLALQDAPPGSAGEESTSFG